MTIQDPEAGYNVKQGSDGKRKTTYGFKAHTNVDEDSAYKSAKHRKLLKQRKVKECITHRAYRNTPLSEEQIRQNRYFSSTRSRVEHVFGILKLHYGLGKARYLGVARNQARVVLISMAYNLKRALRIQRECDDGR